MIGGALVGPKIPQWVLEKLDQAESRVIDRKNRTAEARLEADRQAAINQHKKLYAECFRESTDAWMRQIESNDSVDTPTLRWFVQDRRRAIQNPKTPMEESYRRNAQDRAWNLFQKRLREGRR